MSNHEEEIKRLSDALMRKDSAVAGAVSFTTTHTIQQIEAAMRQDEYAGRLWISNEDWQMLKGKLLNR